MRLLRKNGFFEIFQNAEFNDFLGGNAHHFAGPGIPGHTGFAVLQLENTQAIELDLVLFLESLIDRATQGLHDIVHIFLFQPSFVRQRPQQFALGQRPPPWILKSGLFIQEQKALGKDFLRILRLFGAFVCEGTSLSGQVAVKGSGAYLHKVSQLGTP